jgi:hypothetical protein
MPDISIFAQPAHINTNPSQPYTGGPVKRGHIQRVSSMIRGDQITERLGARLNPADGYATDVCIYVKPHVKNGMYFQFEGRPYLDIVDAWGLTALAHRNPQVGVIACSDQDGATLGRVLTNRVTVIPQHHCNFERVVRAREGITRVGVIGALPAFDKLPAGLAPALAERGIELECYSKFFSRQDVIDFYQRIDVQLVWRPYKMRLSNPLKIVNAASFGVPTIAYREDVFREVADCYMPVTTLAELLAELDRLRGLATLYQDYSSRCRAVAERYHIDRIAELYRRLQ